MVGPCLIVDLKIEKKRNAHRNLVGFFFAHDKRAKSISAKLKGETGMLVNTTVEEVPFEGDTLNLFNKLAGERSNTTLLESMDGNGKNNRQSLLFINSALRIEAREQTVSIFALTDNGRVALSAMSPSLQELGRIEHSIDRADVHFPKVSHTGSDIDRITARSTLDAIRLLCQGWQCLDQNHIPIHTPGIFSYDHLEQFEVLPKAREDRLNFPSFAFWLPERMVILDHVEKKARIITHAYGEQSLDKGASIETTDLVDLIRQTNAKCPETTPIGAMSSKGTVTSQPVEVDIDDDTYAALVEKLKTHIVKGDVFQIVASRTFSKPCPDPAAVYGKLRRLNPSPYMFLVRAEDFTLFGASPEACVRVIGTPRKVEIHPIAGTRPRGFTKAGEADIELDSRYEAELKLNEKELAEHMMLVDLARNDVARVSLPGTRRVKRLLEVERYSHVMHLVSVIEGELRHDLDALHAYLASMNMGTLVGAPKVEAAKLLRLHEADRRGPYGGAVGYLTSEGELDTAIVIRSALVKDGIARVRAGAGIVFDSDPEAETDETRNKANAVLRAIQIVEGDLK